MYLKFPSLQFISSEMNVQLATLCNVDNGILENVTGYIKTALSSNNKCIHVYVS